MLEPVSPVKEKKIKRYFKNCASKQSISKERVRNRKITEIY